MQMLCLLKSQDVVGFVDGGIIRPPDNDDEQKLWIRTDALIQGWLLGSIGKDSLLAVWHNQIRFLDQTASARDIWLRLHQIFKDEEEYESADNIFTEEEEYESVDGDYSMYLPLYKAAQRGDWETAENFFRDINELGTTIISPYSETVLHVAVLTGEANGFVKKLVELMPADKLARKDWDGDTALHYAAMVGNTEAAEIMVEKNPDLVHILNKHNEPAVVTAAVCCHKATLECLISMSQPHQSQLGIRVLFEIISSEFLDVALDLVKKHKKLAVIRDDDGNSALLAIAQTDLFPRLETFSWWESFIYHCIPLKKTKCEAAVHGDIESIRKESAAQNYDTWFQTIFGGNLPQFHSTIYLYLPMLNNLI